MTTSRLAAARIAVVACVLYALAGCKPAAAPSQATQNQTTGDARHQPTTEQLAVFVRANLPPVLRLVELKNDPPVPMPGTAPGGNTWLYTVRLTFAPVEDELGAPAPKDTQAFNTMVDELNGLVAWSQAYAQSPYASLYPGFTVNPLSPASPQLLVISKHKDRPVAPVYGKIGAEWQVDHWLFTVEDLSLPQDNGQFRSAFTGPILIQGDPETARFVAAGKEAIAQAKPRKEAIERAYRDDLLKATAPGTLYRGQMSYRGKAMPAEVRFTSPPGGDPDLARFELRLPASGYVYTCSAKLAKGIPNMPAPATRADDTLYRTVEPEPKDDLTVNYEHVIEPSKFDPGDYPASELRYAYGGTKDALLSVRNHQLEGKMALFAVPLPGIVLTAQQQSP